jgi:hypothetical protein
MSTPAPSSVQRKTRTPHQGGSDAPKPPVVKVGLWPSGQVRTGAERTVRLGVWAAEGFRNEHPKIDLSESHRSDFLNVAKGLGTPENATCGCVGVLPPRPLGPRRKPGRHASATSSLRLHPRTNKPSQGWAVDWVLQESIERPDLASGLVLGRADENEHRRSVEALPLSHLFSQRPAIGIWHLQINQHGVELRAGQQGARFGRGTAYLSSPGCLSTRLTNNSGFSVRHVCSA